MSKTTLVVVTFSKEYPMLRMQASNIAKYCNPSQFDITYFINDESGIPSELVVLLKDTLASFNVKFINVYPNIVSQCWDGWRSQQVVKLLAHRYVETETYVSMDTKQFFQRPPEFFDGDKIKTSLDMVMPFTRPWFESAMRVIGSDVMPTRIVSCLPPITLVTSVVRDMVNSIPNIEQAFRDDENLMDYFLYNAWLAKQDLTHLYSFGERLSSNVQQCHNSKRIQVQMREMERTMVGSIHRLWFGKGIDNFIENKYLTHTDLNDCAIRNIINEIKSHNPTCLSQ